MFKDGAKPCLQGRLICPAHVHGQGAHLFGETRSQPRFVLGSCDQLSSHGFRFLNERVDLVNRIGVVIWKGLCFYNVAPQMSERGIKFLGAPNAGKG